MLKTLSFLILLVAQVAFASAPEMPKLYSPAGAPASAEVRERFLKEYAHKPFDPQIWPEIKIKILKDGGGAIGTPYTIYEIDFPSWNHFENKFENFKFKFYASHHNRTSSKRLVVISPTIEGETILERSLAKQALAAGQSALIAPVFEFEYQKGEGALFDITKRTIYGTNAIRTFFDFLEYTHQNYRHSLPLHFDILRNVIPHEIIQIGSSNGAVATQLVSIDKRVSDQILIVPVANVPGVMAATKNKKLSQFREEQMKFYGLTDPLEYAKLARKKMKIDPLDMTHYTSHVRTLMFTQADDATVPTVFQTELSERIRASKLANKIREFREETKMAEDFIFSGKSPAYNELREHIKSVTADDSAQLLELFDKSATGTSHFHEVGWGHTKKILSIIFLFNKEIREVLVQRPTVSSEMRIESIRFRDNRAQPLVNTRSCSQKFN